MEHTARSIAFTSVLLYRGSRKKLRKSEGKAAPPVEALLELLGSYDQSQLAIRITLQAIVVPLCLRSKM